MLESGEGEATASTRQKAGTVSGRPPGGLKRPAGTSAARVTDTSWIVRRVRPAHEASGGGGDVTGAIASRIASTAPRTELAIAAILLDRALRRERPAVAVAQEVTYVATALGMTAAGVGIAILPDAAAALAPAGVTRVPIRGPVLTRQIAVLVRTGRS